MSWVDVDLKSGAPNTFRFESLPKSAGRLVDGKWFQVASVEPYKPISFKGCRLTLHGATGSVSLGDDEQTISVSVFVGREYQVHCRWPDGATSVLLRGRVT